MARIVFTGLAEADIAEIQADLAAVAGRRLVLKYDGAFERLFDRLAKFPLSGAPRLGLGPDIRIGVVSPYVVIYRYLADDDSLTVLRVVDGRRRIGSSMFSGRN